MVDVRVSLHGVGHTPQQARNSQLDLEHFSFSQLNFFSSNLSQLARAHTPASLEQSIRVGTFLSPPFLNYHTNTYSDQIVAANKLQLKGEDYKFQSLMIVALPKMSIEKQYLGPQDLVNDLDEWEEGWLGWVGGREELQLSSIFLPPW